MKTMKLSKDVKQEALETVIAELERNLQVLEGNYRSVVTNLKTLRERVETDDLTKLMRRGAFMSKLDGLLHQTSAAQSADGVPVQVMMIDVDHFKNVNDSYGHQTGDLVLERVAELVKNCLRTGDLAGRYGGEEFVVGMQASFQEACMIAENIRAAVEAQLLRSVGTQAQFSVTLSIGVASTQDFGFESADLIQQADQALYRAKRTGRNKVQRASKVTLHLVGSAVETPVESEKLKKIAA